MPSEFQMRMAFFEFLAVVVALPFFGLFLLTMDRKMGRLTLAILDGVTRLEEIILKRVENYIWRREYRWCDA